MRYRLRTLMILLAIGPPLLAGVIGRSMSVWEYQSGRTFLRKLYEADAVLDRLVLDSEPPMLSLSP